jgi:calcium-dependent protein kinase
MYTHKNNICHRDLKPENFLYEVKKEDSILKLIDFGLATLFTELKKENKKQGVKKQKIMKRLNTQAGTPLYMSPEVINRNYSSSCDIWSAGVILYIMLCGYPPFYGDTDIEVYKKITTYDYEFDDEVWDGISDEAKDLIKKILVPDPERLKVKGALKHPWLVKNTPNEKD